MKLAIETINTVNWAVSPQISKQLLFATRGVTLKKSDWLLIGQLICAIRVTSPPAASACCGH